MKMFLELELLAESVDEEDDETKENRVLISPDIIDAVRQMPGYTEIDTRSGYRELTYRVKEEYGYIQRKIKMIHVLEAQKDGII